MYTRRAYALPHLFAFFILNSLYTAAIKAVHIIAENKKKCILLFPVITFYGLDAYYANYPTL